MGKLIERLEEVETVIHSRSKHEFLAKKGFGRVGRSTYLLGADQRLSGEGVFNGIYYCPLGFRAPCTCIPLCMRLVILMFWLRASILSIVNSEAIVICLLLSWRDSFSKLSLRWSWLWNVVWSVKNVICLLISWRNCLDRVVMASEAIVICLLLSWRDSFSKLSARWSWLKCCMASEECNLFVIVMTELFR